MTTKEIDHVDALFDKTYLRWFHLIDNQVLVEIEKIRRKVQMTLPGGRKASKTVIDLKLIKGEAMIKPLVLNVTNGHQIAEIHGDKPSLWPGKQVVLFKSETDVYSEKQGKMVKTNCIRIRAPKETK